MDYRQITDLLLQSGMELAKQGQVMAEQKLQIPETGPEREALLSGLGKGAAAGGVLALLLGTDIGRKLTGSTLKLGSLAALGGVAYQAYQKWQSQAADAEGTPIDQLKGQEAETRSLALLKAVVAASKADGHIDDAERARIEQQLQNLSLDAASIEFFKKELEKPLSAKEVAAGVESPAAASEIYLASLAVIDEQNDMERTYLQDLAKELKLPPELVAALETQAKT